MNFTSIEVGLIQLKAITEYLDQGSAFATFVFYSDTKPVNVSIAADESKRLVTLSLPKPCFKKLNADSIELNQTDAALVVKSGAAKWARLYSGAGVAVTDFLVGTDITISEPNLIEGSTLMLNSIVLKPTPLPV